MATLSGKARTHLRGLAHHLRPAVQVGKAGLTESVLRTVDEALLGSEFIKVQIAAMRGDRRALATAIAEGTNAECVGIVGRIAIFYRPHPEEERRRIKLPG